MFLEEYCRQLQQRIPDLEKENARLRGLLGLDVPKPAEDISVISNNALIPTSNIPKLSWISGKPH